MMRRLVQQRIQGFFFCTALAAAAVSFAQAQDITGDWQGPLTLPRGELRVVVHVSKGPDGSLKGIMDSPDQAIVGAPLDSISVEGSKVNFTLNAAKGSFTGAMKGNGSIAGTWTQGTPPQKMQLVLAKTTTPIKTQHDAAPPSDIDGTWAATLEGEEEGKVHLTFHIKNTADGLIVTTDSPEMHIQGWPATSVTRKGSTLKVGLKQINAKFEGKLNKSLDAMSGGWMEGDDASHPLTFKRTKEDSPPAEKP
jgi:hypothetical protein